ncbi:RNA polymerase, sigma-24 subunit, RpoE, ECF subfamily [Colwellia psychrerythraea]|uniref:RNA polymerase, sigma-24 subunit, RpoE, ECF subfamily n=2 Tax=Colwellia psychrerythraea TaxID=28229 RepID=A0A099KQ34_COLPS|nr:RNA polymerase, sigma-24 subunit, RpoE, ECF subfamily [Colwellia psychrerythraea]
MSERLDICPTPCVLSMQVKSIEQTWMARNSTLTTLFLSTKRNIGRLIRHIVKTDDIDDIVQETFIKTYEADLKQEIKYVRSYMLKTAKNLALNHVARWDNKYNDSLEDFAQPPVQLTSRKIEDDYESKEQFLFFCRATDQLSGSVRKCFILKKVYGLSQKEIASYLDLSESTVEKHIAKGLLKSTKYIKRMNLDHGDVSVNKNIASK